MRWRNRPGGNVESPRIDAFLDEVHELCKKHGFCIEVDDPQVGFTIEVYRDEKDFEWLGGANVGATVEDA